MFKSIFVIDQSRHIKCMQFYHFILRKITKNYETKPHKISTTEVKLDNLIILNELNASINISRGS